MQIHALDGTVLEISTEEAHRIHDEVGKPHTPAALPAVKSTVPEYRGESHHFHIGGKQIPLTRHEMKMVADTWWEEYGKHSMEHYFTEMKAKAARHIAEAVDCKHEPVDEAEVKNALAHALAGGDADVIAEVIHESAEWVNANSGIRSIEYS